MAASARPPDITSTTALCFPSTHLFLFQHRLATAEYHHHPQHRRQQGIRRFATAIQQRPNPPPPQRARTHRRDRRALEIRDKAGFPPAATQPKNGLTSLEKPTRHSQQNKTLESSLVEEAATALHFLAIFQIKNHTPPPTMLSSTLLCIASALLASAHTVITYPGWRGNNLLTNTDFPYGMQWAYPCKSPPRRLPPLPSLTTPSRRRHPLDNEPDVLASNRRRGRLPTRMVPGPLDRLHLRQHGSRD